MAHPTHISDGTGTKKKATVSTDIVDSSNRLHVNARLALGSQVTIVPAAAGSGIGALYRQFLMDSGGSSNMVINGASTPTDFTAEADASQDTAITELRFTFTALSLDWSSTAFGKGGGVLSNGVLIDVLQGSTTTVIANLKVNEDFLMLPARSTPMLSQSGNRDVLSVAIDMGGLVVLEHNTADRVRVRIRDDMTPGARDINYFQFAIFGVRTTP